MLYQHGISAGLILQIFNEDYDLIVIKTLERVYKNYYYIITRINYEIRQVLKGIKTYKKTYSSQRCM